MRVNTGGLVRNASVYDDPLASSVQLKRRNDTTSKLSGLYDHTTLSFLMPRYGTKS